MQKIQRDSSFEVLSLPNSPPEEIEGDSAYHCKVTDSLGHSLSCSLNYYSTYETLGTPSNSFTPNGASGEQGIIRTAHSPCSEIDIETVDEEDTIPESHRTVDSIHWAQRQPEETGMDVQDLMSPDCSKEHQQNPESGTEYSSGSSSFVNVLETDAAGGDTEAKVNECQNIFDREDRSKSETGDKYTNDSQGIMGWNMIQHSTPMAKNSHEDITDSCVTVRDEHEDVLSVPDQCNQSKFSVRREFTEEAELHHPDVKNNLPWSHSCSDISLSAHQSLRDIFLSAGLAELNKTWQREGINIRGFAPRVENSSSSSSVRLNDEEHLAGTSMQASDAQHGPNALRRTEQGSSISAVWRTTYDEPMPMNLAPLRTTRVPSGVFEWFKRSSSMQRIFRHAKISFNSLLTIMDPGMAEFIEPEPILNITVVESDPRITSSVRKGFANVVSFSQTPDVRSLPAFVPGIPPQPVGFYNGLLCAQKKINYARDRFLATSCEVLIATSPVLVEITPVRWHSTTCVLLDDPVRNLSLHAYTQTTPVANEYVIQAQMRTPENYKLKHLGLCATVGDIIASLAVVCPKDWQKSLSDVSCYKQLEDTVTTLAGMYRNYLEGWNDNLYYGS